MSSTERKLRVAVVGAGLMGRWHATYSRRLGAEVAAVVDRSPAAAAALARHAGGAATFVEMGAMLAQARPQVVHVCTPLASHLSLALEAVDAGAHALVEKPLTCTASQTQALLQRARLAGVLVCPVHQFAFQRGVSRAARALESLGDALHANFTICSAGGDTQSGQPLDSIVADILPHPLSILQSLWPGSALRPDDWTAVRPRPGELQVRGDAGGTTVNICVSMNARPTQCELDILCASGSLHLNFFHGYAVVRRGVPSRFDKITQPLRFAASSFAIAASNLAGRAWRRESAYPGLSSLIGQFYAAARGTAGNPIPPQDVLAAAIVRDHVIRQALPAIADQSVDLEPAFGSL